MNKTDIAKQTAKILLDTQSVLVNTKEPFHYTSGKRGPVYVDIRRMMSFPKERGVLMDYAADILKPLNADYIAGGETAGIPYAAFIAERLNKPMLYIRKKPKGHGRMAQIEGHMEEGGKSVVLIEDLQNRGTSQAVFLNAIREAGAFVKDVFVIFSYNIYGKEERDTALHYLCDWHAVLDAMREQGEYDADTLSSLQDYLNDPNGWEERFNLKTGT